MATQGGGFFSKKEKQIEQKKCVLTRHIHTMLKKYPNIKGGDSCHGNSRKYFADEKEQIIAARDKAGLYKGRRSRLGRAHSGTTDTDTAMSSIRGGSRNSSRGVGGLGRNSSRGGGRVQVRGIFIYRVLTSKKKKKNSEGGGGLNPLHPPPPWSRHCQCISPITVGRPTVHAPTCVYALSLSLAFQ